MSSPSTPGPDATRGSGSTLPSDAQPGPDAGPGSDPASSEGDRSLAGKLLPGRIRLQRWRGYTAVWSIAPLLIVVVAAAAYTVNAYRAAAAELVIERDRQLASLSAARLEDELQKLADELVTLARSEDMVVGSIGDQLAALEAERLRLSVFDGGVVLLDEHGRVRGAQPDRPTDVGRDWSGRHYFRALLGASGLVFADTPTDGPDGTPAVVVSVPVQGRSGELRGALVGMFRLGQPTISPFYASIVRLRIGQSGNTYLVGSDGRILFDSGVDEVGQPFATAGLPEIELTPEGGAKRTQDAAGNDVLAAWEPVPGTPWMLVTEDDWATLTRSTRHYLRVLLLVLGLGMLLPAAGVGLMARRHGREVLERERVAYEAHVAELIGRALLPRDVPLMPGWRVAAHYLPAGAGRGGLYDWLLLPDGTLLLVVVDVSEKRVAAVPVMATVRTLLREAAHRGLTPGDALAHCNDRLCADMPPGISATCLYARLDPSSGRLAFASAGHAAPYHCGASGLEPLAVAGAPLGEALGRQFEDGQVTVQPGECVLFCSVGLLEARSPQGEAFSAVRLAQSSDDFRGAGRLLAQSLLAELKDFGGPGWAPDADVTLLVLEHVAGSTDGGDASG